MINERERDSDTSSLSAPCYPPVAIQSFVHQTVNEPKQFSSPPAASSLKHTASFLFHRHYLDVKCSSDFLAGDVSDSSGSSWSPPIRPLLNVFSSFSCLYRFWNTSHICQNRSIEFKQMSEGQTTIATGQCILLPDVSPSVCVCVRSKTAMLNPS